MALEFNITKDDRFFKGEDKTIEYVIYDENATPASIADGTARCLNASSFAMRWLLKQSVNDADAAAKITKATSGNGITVSAGAFNVDPAINLQRVQVAIADTDTEEIAHGTYYKALKRTDDGFEAILSFGTLVLRQAAALA